MSIDVERLRAEIEADPTDAIAGLTAFDAALSRSTRDRTSDIDVDTASAFAGIVAFNAEMDVATRDRDIDIDVDRSALSGFAGTLGTVQNGLQGVTGAATTATGAIGGGGSGGGGLGTAFGGAGKSGMFFTQTMIGLAQGFAQAALSFIPMMAMLSVLPGALTAAAGGVGIFYAALQPLLGLALVIAPAIGALVTVLGVVAAALIPVMQGVSAYKDMTDDTSAAAKELDTRQKAVADSARAIAQAQRGVIQAEEALARARQNLSDAPHDAAEALEDQHFATRQAILSEKQAVEALKDAQKALADSQKKTADVGYNLTKQVDEFTGKSYDVAYASEAAADSSESERAARLRLQQAELDLARAKDNTQDQQRSLNEMEQKGIRNSDIMVDRRRAVRDAEWALADARQSVVDATERQADAVRDLNTQIKDGTAPMQAWSKAQESLSAKGEEFVKFIADDFLPGIKDIAKAAQDGLLPGVQDGLEMWMDVFPKVEEEARIVGDTLGRAFRRLSRFWTGDVGQDRLTDMFAGLNDVIDAGGNLMTPFSKAMVSLVDVASPLLVDMINGLAGLFEDIDKWASSNRGAEAMEDAAWFGEKWWDSLGSILRIFRAIGRALKPLAEDMMGSMTDSLDETADYLESDPGQKGILGYVEKTLPTLELMGDIITDIFDLLFGTSTGGEDSAFFSFLTALKEDLLPEIKDLMEDLDQSDMAGGFVTGIAGLVEVIGTIDWKQLGEDIETIASALRGVSGAVDELGGGGTVGKIMGFINPLELLGGTAEDTWEAVNGRPPKSKNFQTLRGLWGGFSDWWSGTLVPNVKSVWSMAMDNVFRDSKTGRSRVQMIWSGIQNWWRTNVTQPIREAWSKMWDRIKDYNWSNLGRDIGTAIWEGIKGGFGSLADLLKPGGEDSDPGKYNLPFAPDIPKSWNPFNQFGGPVEAGEPTIVGEKRAEIFVPSVGGRIMPRATPSDLASMSGGSQDAMSAEDIRKIVEAVMDGKKDVEINQTFNEKVDPHHVAKELAWSLR